MWPWFRIWDGDGSVDDFGKPGWRKAIRAELRPGADIQIFLDQQRTGDRLDTVLEQVVVDDPVRRRTLPNTGGDQDVGVENDQSHG